MPITCHSQIFVKVIFLAAALCLSSCSVPNLEEPACTEARNSVQQFYAFHFGNDMRPSLENIELRKKYLTASLVDALSASGETKTDYFTASAEYPKAFKSAECRIVSPTQTEFRVHLFWRTNDQSVQKEVTAEVLKENDKWLINKVSSK